MAANGWFAAGMIRFARFRSDGNRRGRSAEAEGRDRAAASGERLRFSSNILPHMGAGRQEPRGLSARFSICAGFPPAISRRPSPPCGKDAFYLQARMEPQADATHRKRKHVFLIFRIFASMGSIVSRESSVRMSALKSMLRWPGRTRPRRLLPRDGLACATFRRVDVDDARKSPLIASRSPAKSLSAVTPRKTKGTRKARNKTPHKSLKALKIAKSLISQLNDFNGLRGVDRNVSFRLRNIRCVRGGFRPKNVSLRNPSIGPSRSARPSASDEGRFAAGRPPTRPC
jgi:hypothetical protein